MKGTIVLDFDGVIHKCGKGHFDGTIYDLPIDGSLQKINQLINLGYEIIICTAREELDPIRAWLKKWEFPDLKVTNIKPRARWYVDDRAIRFTNWEDIYRYF